MKFSSKAIACLIAAAVLAAGGYWLLLPSDAKGLRIDADDMALVARGKAIYAEQCAACHGVKLEGQPDWQQRRPDGKLPAPPHDVTGHTWHHGDGQLFDIVKFGVGKFAGPDYRTDMPAYEDSLPDDDIRAVIAFIKSTWPARERAIQEQQGAAR